MNFLNKVFNKEYEKTTLKRCTHCIREEHKLKKCDNCRSRTICNDCHYVKGENLCRICDLEYTKWAKNLKKVHEIIEKEEKRDKKKRKYKYIVKNIDDDEDLTNVLL